MVLVTKRQTRLSGSHLDVDGLSCLAIDHPDQALHPTFKVKSMSSWCPTVVLSDHSVLKLYGQKVKLFKLGRMPAQMIIDKKGFLRFIHYGHDMSDIPANEEVLSLLENLEDQTTE